MIRPQTTPFAARTAMLLDYYSLKRPFEREAGESEAAVGVAEGNGYSLQWLANRRRSG